MNTCGTCKYRGKTLTAYRPRYDENHNYLGSDKMKLSYSLCGKIQMSKEIISDQDDYPTNWEEPGSKAVVTDGSGYYAALCVESDFGCNLWEIK